MSMVEKVARAMCVEGGYDPNEIMPNDGPRWRYYEPNAQAALRALEVPTQGMKMAGAQAITADHMKKAANYDAACDAWSAMIAAAREG